MPTKQIANSPRKRLIPAIKNRLLTEKDSLLIKCGVPRLKLREAWAKRFDPQFESYQHNSPLVCVFTGMEHSGTTLISQLLNGHPRICSGVECGLLLSNIHDYDKAKPFYQWLIIDGWHWGLTEQDRKTLTTACSYDEAYGMLSHYKGRGNSDPKLRELFAEAPLIYDKTPAYIYRIDEIIKKVKQPFIVTIKTPREGLESCIKRGQSVSDFLNYYALAMKKTMKAYTENPNRLLLVSYKSLSTDHEAVMERIQSFIKIEDPVNLSLDRYNQSFGRLIKKRNSFHSDEISYSPPSIPLSESDVQALNNFNRKWGKLIDEISQICI